ncbi:unnamed protein product [Diabrotica balteata]|uniref:Pre-mRNA polyadenylation factor Fip1 domain-containing protein n=1 Tax=Diabrotica balteata TaxID=107213 RepID=A0A9N9T5F2_DIABA|nr:unnamed protein product [Diabrotica balteata]
MADDLEDDKWLYGETAELNNGEAANTDSHESEQKEESETPQEEEPRPKENAEAEREDSPLTLGIDTDERERQNDETKDSMEDGEVQQNGDDSEKEDLDDDSDDDVNVVIGDIKTTTPASYTALNIKRGGLLSAVGDKNKQIQQQQQPGKFTVEEFDQIGSINGVLASEFNFDSLEDKPWKKPGADITDYFNYGFNEDTWRAYCERQKRIRVNDSGTGLVPMTMMSGLPRVPVPIMNDNSKYTGNFAGNNQRMQPQQNKTDQVTKVNTIQVMTADRREYSRKPGFPDLSVPPPATFENFEPEYGFNPEPEPFYGAGYEPTQDVQWGNEPPPAWAPSELKTLTGPPPMGPPSMHMGPPPSMGVRSPSTRRDSSPHREHRDRERESRSRSEKPRDRDRERERSHRRERSRSRSRRHRSRSRSPSHRSHRKKKSKRHDDSE